MRYEIEVFETRVHRMVYVIEADTLADAEDMATVGDNIDEWETGSGAEVICRTVGEVRDNG